MTNKEYYRKYYQKNQERIREYTRRWHQEHSNYINEHIRKRRLEDPEFRKKLREKFKKWKQNNPEKEKERHKRYRHSEKGKIRDKKRWLKRKEIYKRKIDEATKEYIKERDKVCIYCGLASRLQIEHIYPRDDASPSNLVLSCIFCNSSKNNREIFKWLKEKFPNNYENIIDRITKIMKSDIIRYERFISEKEVKRLDDYLEYLRKDELIRADTQK